MRASLELTRQVHRVSRRRLVGFVAASSLGIAATALMTALVITRSEVAPPVAVIAVPLPYPVAPPPVLESGDPALAPPTTSPRIDAACVLPHPLGLADRACGGDDGFPAISADGSLIVSSYNPDAGGPGLIIRFVDTRTSRLVREIVVLSLGELDPYAVTQPAELPALIARRAAAAQRIIDAGRYRSLRRLAEGHGFDLEGGNGDDPPGGGDLGTEIAGDALRGSDGTTSTVLVQTRFSTAAFPPTCPPGGPRSVDAWRDDVTRHVYAEVTYLRLRCYRDDGQRRGRAAT